MALCAREKMGTVGMEARKVWLFRDADGGLWFGGFHRCVDAPISKGWGRKKCGRMTHI